MPSLGIHNFCGLAEARRVHGVGMCSASRPPAHLASCLLSLPDLISSLCNFYNSLAAGNASVAAEP